MGGTRARGPGQCTWVKGLGRRQGIPDRPMHVAQVLGNPRSLGGKERWARAFLTPCPLSGVPHEDTTQTSWLLVFYFLSFLETGQVLQTPPSEGGTRCYVCILGMPRECHSVIQLQEAAQNTGWTHFDIYLILSKSNGFNVFIIKTVCLFHKMVNSETVEKCNYYSNMK